MRLKPRAFARGFCFCFPAEKHRGVLPGTLNWGPRSGPHVAPARQPWTTAARLTLGPQQPSALPLPAAPSLRFHRAASPPAPSGARTGTKSITEERRAANHLACNPRARRRHPRFHRLRIADRIAPRWRFARRTRSLLPALEQVADFREQHL